jgi:hypothetical protein
MAWYIVKQATGSCEVIHRETAVQRDTPETEPQADEQTWGPFESQGEAIARRVGLIRAGKCQPV